MNKPQLHILIIYTNEGSLQPRHQQHILPVPVWSCRDLSLRLTILNHTREIVFIQSLRLKHKYRGITYQVELAFPFPVALVLFPYLAGWLIGSLATKCSKTPTAKIPRKNLIYCAAAVLVATLTYNIEIVESSYPVVIMVKSGSIVSVMIVGFICTRGRDHRNKLGKIKLITGALVTIGILLFCCFATDYKDGDK